MNRLRGQTLVASMIVIVIILILAVVLFQGSGAFSSGKPTSSRADGHGTTTIGQVRYDAKDDVCRSNLTQVRQAIEIATTTDDEHPATLQDLKLPAEFYACPIDHEPYVYDPASGRVYCPHPGHEKY